MIALIQRVKHANVVVEAETVGQIGQGLLVLLGVEKDDTPLTVQKMARKICNYRVFSDDAGKMNLNVQQVQGDLLLVSQFTLVAETEKGNRPSFSKGATPEHGFSMYQLMIDELAKFETKVETGRFGADMAVSLLNDGPVTFNLKVK